MAGEVRLNRLNKYYGGITIDDKDSRPGVALNVEEIDIFGNPSYIQPETVFSTDDAVVSNGLFDYAFDGSTLYGLGKSSNVAGADIKIWKLASASASDPGAWAAHATSANDFDAYEIPAMLFHEQTESSTLKKYVYYTGTPASGGIPLRRMGDLTSGGTTETSTDTASTSMVMTGITTSLNTTAPRPRIKLNGEIFFGHGQYIAKVDDTGVFVEKAFTLPNGWYCVDFAETADTMYILASNDGEPNVSKIFIWDLTATSGFDDVIVIPIGGALAVFNDNEVMRVWCVQNSTLFILELLGKVPFVTHTLANVQNIDNAGTSKGTGTVYRPVMKQFMFAKSDVIYFGLWKSDKNGLYALGRTNHDNSKPLALVLAKRFVPSGTSNYATHRPLSATAVGANFYLSYYDYGSANTYKVSRLEGNNSPSRSSDAVYESIYIDGGKPEYPKEWFGFVAVTQPIPASCSIKVDARVDNASSYNSTISADSTMTLSSSNDQVLDGSFTADTNWFRSWEAINGRALQLKLTFTSSTTNAAKLYVISPLSRDGTLS